MTRQEIARRSRTKNFDKRKEYLNQWRAKNPDKIRAQNRRAQLKLKYGLTPQTWESLFESQGRRCACCGSDSPGSKKGWHTDHNHETKKVREILCQPCNVMIAHAKDDPARLEAGIRYLEKHGEGKDR